MNSFALGSAQFGSNYGIANQTGKPNLQEVKKILQFARSKNIDLVDTAMSYGDSEKTLGIAGIEGFKIVSKLPSPPTDISDIEKWINEKVKLSLNRLGINSLYGLLIHESDNIFSKSGKIIIKSLKKLKSNNIVEKIGISVYEPYEIDKLNDLINLDIIQIPLNIFDQRFIRNSYLSNLVKNNIEVHARSVFLQGLLLMPKQNRPLKFNKWHPLWKLWDEWLIDNNISALEATLRFAFSIKKITKFIVGLDSKKHLQQAILAVNGNLPTLPKELFSDDVNLINPSNWKKL